MEKKLTKAENLKKSNNFIDRLEKVKSFLLLKLEITLKENSKIHRILNRIITKRNKYFNDIEKREFYKIIEESKSIENLKEQRRHLLDIKSIKMYER